MLNENKVSETRTSQHEPEREQRILGFKLTQVVWLLFGILVALIVIRIGLRLIGANPDSPIVGLIYAFTFLYLFPFEGLINSPSSGNMVLELSSIFAIAIYALIAWVAERVIWLIFYRPRGPVVAVTETSTSESQTHQ